MPLDVENVLVQVGASADGPFTTIEDMESYDATHGTESPTRRRVFGRAAPYVRAGDDTDAYDLSGLLNLQDTGGQNFLRDGRDNRTTVFLRVLPAGDEVGALGYMQCAVTEYTDSGEGDGDYVECSFSLEGAGVKMDVTIPAA